MSGAAASNANLGTITVELRDGAGAPIVTGTTTVNLAGPTGSSFGTSQFGSGTTTLTISGSASTATFWYGNSNTGGPTITASATGFVSGSQQETITTAPAGLGMAITGGSGTPVVSCGSVSTNYTCAVSGVGSGGDVDYTVSFDNSSGSPVVYSATQSSTIAAAGSVTPSSVTIRANSSSSSPNTLDSSHSGGSTKTTTLTFGPYTLKITVDS